MKVSEAAAMLKKSGVNLPEEVILVSESNRGSLFFNSSQEILEASLPGSDQLTYEVKYDIPGRGR